MAKLTIIGDSLFFQGYEIAKFKSNVPPTVLEDAKQDIARKVYHSSGTFQNLLNS